MLFEGFRRKGEKRDRGGRSSNIVDIINESTWMCTGSPPILSKLNFGRRKSHLGWMESGFFNKRGKYQVGTGPRTAI